jgi:hypothetical protein
MLSVAASISRLHEGSIFAKSNRKDVEKPIIIEKSTTRKPLTS